MGVTVDSTHDITTLDGFFRENPFFLAPWAALIAIQYAVFNYIPAVTEWCSANNMVAYGMWPAAQLAVYAVLAQFIVHGMICTYANQLDAMGLKIQDKKYIFQADEVAMRSSLIIIVTMLAYGVTPMSTADASLLQIFVGYSILNILHDFWFYWVHRAAHTKQLYQLIHKTHHTWKQPMAFSAYYIRSPSQILQEHAFVIPCMLLMPVPVMSFVLYQYIGAPLSMLEHSGYRLGEVPLPIFGKITLPFVGTPSIGWVTTVLGGGWSLILGSQSVEMHDDHHENFLCNYALSYSYLDHIFGTYKAPERLDTKTPLLAA